MGKPIAGVGQFPFTPNGKKVNAAKIDGTDHVGNLSIYKQRSDIVYDLMDDANVVYQHITITSRDKDLMPMDVATSDATLVTNLKNNTFFIKETDPSSGASDFVHVFHLHKTILSSGKVIFEQNTIQPPVVNVTGVTVSPSTLSGNVGSTGQLAATVLPADATDPSVAWTSSDNTVCTVNDSGLVSYLKAGSATVTATTTDGEFTGTSAVTVTTPVVNVTGVTLDKTTITAVVGDSPTQLTATVAPSNATNKAVTWQSSNTAACTVSNTGLVTIVAEGSSTITVTTTDGNKTATCAVTITAA